MMEAIYNWLLFLDFGKAIILYLLYDPFIWLEYDMLFSVKSFMILQPSKYLFFRTHWFNTLWFIIFIFHPSLFTQPMVLTSEQVQDTIRILTESYLNSITSLVEPNNFRLVH